MASCTMDLEKADQLLLGTKAFNSIDQVQKMIKRLQLVEKDMKKRVDQSKENGVHGPDEIEELSFETLPLIDLDMCKTEPEDSWLIDAQEIPGITKLRTESNFLDTRLLNIRNSLVNTVKAALNEERANRITLVRLKRNASYVIRRDNDSSDRESCLLPSPSPRRNNDVTATYTYRLAGRRFSPATSPGYSTELETDFDNNINTILPLGTNNSPMNRTITVMKTPQSSNKYATITRPSKLGSTFTPTGVDNNNDEMKRNGSHELNRTFIRSSEDEAMSSSSPSGSNHSPHNISMEEIQTKARIQEQSLGMNSSTLRRKDTHVVSDFHTDINGQQVLSSSSRTWSNDTYSCAESNPDSGASSGVSSPRDSQSYENVQLVPNSVRRSMPNLALVKEVNRGNTATVMQIMPKKDQLRSQPQYISDSKLGADRSRTRTINCRPGAAEDMNYTCNPKNPPPSEHVEKSPRQVYRRGDTFYKSNNSPVLQTGSQTNLNGETEQNYIVNLPYGNRPATGGTPTRPSILPTLGLSAASIATSQAQKPKASRIPAPGTRMRYI